MDKGAFFIMKDDGGRRSAAMTTWRGRALLAALALLALLAPSTAQAAPGKLSAGPGHSAALHNDGTVWTWGDNQYGQLGNATTISSATPARVPGLDGIVAVQVRDSFTVALRNDGTVWAWGDNSSGQLGNGSNIGSAVPLRVPGLTGVVAIGAGLAHVLAVRSDGSLWAWGDNDWGQFGNGNQDDAALPIQVQGPNSGITAVDGGRMHSVALKSDGTVWTWGWNSYGQLGIGSTSHSVSMPARVPGVAGVIDIAATDATTFALTENGAVWAWGAGEMGQVGNGTMLGASSPFRVAGLPGPVAALAPGYLHTAVLLADGTIWGWGRLFPLNGMREAFNLVPTRLAPGVSGVAALASGYQYILALRRDGSITAWGDNSRGELGIGAPSYRVVPFQVPGIGSVSAISTTTTGSHTLALRSDGTVWGWGAGASDGSPLGNGSSYPSFVPVQAVGLTGVTAISAGRLFSLAVKGDGTVWSWGWNSWGQLGTGGTDASSVPVQVAGLTGVTRVAAGNDFSLAVKGDGTVWGWGSNRYGELGRADVYATGTPLQLPGLSEVADVSAGTGYGMALKRDGSVWAWGIHGYGEASSTGIVRVTPPESADRIAAGDDHGMVLESGTRQVFLWGRNNDGELCDGTTTWRSTPQPGFQLRNMEEIAPGGSFSTAIWSMDRTVWSCGSNDYGQLGTGSTNPSSQPVQALQLSNIIDIAAGEAYAVALKGDGTVWAWGKNDVGQLGIDSGRQPTQALVNLGTQEVMLSVNISGSGAGSVNSIPAGIACSGGTCSRLFPYRTAVTLRASSGAGSTFAGWSGACTGTSPDCLLTLTSDTTVSANFSGGIPVRIGSTNYPTLTAAYAAAPSGALIMAREGDLVEGMVADRNVAVRLAGGYDAGFSGRSGLPTRLRGKLLLRRGTVRVDRIRVM